MMFSIPAPHGERIEIPTLPSDETIVYPTMSEPAAVRDYYNREGYVVVRDLIAHDILRQNGLECRAPALRKGDVLFWSSRHDSRRPSRPADREKLFQTG